MSNIPKIIHQLWIGPKPPPTKFMQTWKDKHEKLGFEYIFWNEQEFIKRGFTSQLQSRIDSMSEWNGKADILRWEILYKYGGVFVDADSICIEPFDTLIQKYKAFAGYENEKVRRAGWAPKGYDDVLASTHPLIATGTMAFPPNHELPKMAIEWIKNNEICIEKINRRAWRTVGPGLLTRLYFRKRWSDITILPSYLFLPIHCSGLQYIEHGKVYAYQEWGSTKQNYDNMNNISLPVQFTKPIDKVSILISSLNTKAIFIKECLDSIKQQHGHIFFEIIWINDGSDQIHTTILKKLLREFSQTTRFTEIKYYENDGNKGIGFTLNKGVLLCSNEIIIKMDSDDIMVDNRIQKQLKFMKNNPEIAICGGQIAMFKTRGKEKCIVSRSFHKSLEWNEYINKPSHWFINHPTVCYRKSCIIKAGNYDAELKEMAEDFELELRMLKTFKKIYNLPDILLFYRLHENQVTHKGGKKGSTYWNKIRDDIIKNLIEN